MGDDLDWATFLRGYSDLRPVCLVDEYEPERLNAAKFTKRVLCRHFLGRSESWLNLMRKEGQLDHPAFPSTGESWDGFNRVGLVEIERAVYALAQNGRINGRRLATTLLALHTFAEVNRIPRLPKEVTFDDLV